MTPAPPDGILRRVTDWTWAGTLSRWHLGKNCELSVFAPGQVRYENALFGPTLIMPIMLEAKTVID